MAEVTGDFGGQPIQLNNAATEATLKQLLAVMLSQTAKSGKQNLKNEKELRQELDRLAKAAKATTAEHAKFAAESKKVRDKLAKDAKDKEGERARYEHTRQLKEHTRKLEKNIESFKNFSKGIDSSISSLARYATDLSKMGNNVTGATSALGKIPVVGGILAATLGAVAEAAQTSYKSFQQAAEVGANFGGSITEMINSATGAGLTIDQFTGIVARSGQDVALLGKGSASGAKRLAELGKEIKNTNLGDDLARLGYGTEAINSALATNSGMLARNGHLQNMSNQQLIDSTGTYLKNLDAVSKLTGLNKKDIEDQRKARMVDASFRATLSKMDAKSAENLQTMMDTIPKEHQAGLQELIATGTAQSEAAKAALSFLPESAQAALRMNAQINSGIAISSQQARDFSIRHQQSAAAFSKTELARNNISHFGTEAQKQLALGSYNAAARTTDIGKIYDEQEKATQERIAREKAGIKDLDPAEFKRQQEKAAETSNKVMLELATSFKRIVPILDKFHEILSVYLIPTLSWASENIGLAALAIVGLKAASWAIGKGFEKLLGIIAGRALGGAIAGGAGQAAGRAGGTAAGKAAGGMGSMIKTIVGIVASATTAKFIIGALVIGGLFALLFAASKKESNADELKRLRETDEASLTPSEKTRKKQLESIESRGTQGTAVRRNVAKIDYGYAKQILESKDDSLNDTGYSRQVLEEFVKQSVDAKGRMQKVDIEAIATSMFETQQGKFITHKADGTSIGSASLDDLDTSAADAFDEVTTATGNVTTAATDLAGSMSVTAELAKIQQEIDKEGLGLFQRIALERKKFDLEKLQRDKDQLQVTDKLVDVTKEEVALKEKTNACKGYDFSSPEALFKSFRDKNMQPGATGTPSAGGSAGGLQVSAGSQLQGPQKEFYDKLYTTLLAEATKAGVKNPEAIARLGAAQSSIETGYGKALAGGNNFFGIKGSGGNQQTTQEWDPKTQKMVTQKASFRQYGSMQESASDYIKFLQTNSRYKGVLEAGSVEDAIAAQGKTGYATDPDYAKKLAWVQSSATGTGVNLPGTSAVPPRPPVTPLANAATAAIAPQAAPVVPGQTTPNQPGTGAPGAGGASPANELAAAIERLNSMTAQIVGYSKEVAETSRLQLTALKSVGKVY